MDKGILGFLLLFVLLIAGSQVFGSFDQITPAVAEAQADLSLGTGTVQVVKKGASLVFSLLIGAIVTGVAAAAFSEARKFYKTWKRNGLTRRWQAGPNAQWQQNTPKTPSLKREDLLLLALAGKSPATATNSKRGAMRVEEQDDDIDLEF